MTTWRTSLIAVLLAVIASTGCIKARRAPVLSIPDMPKELTMTTLPDHIIEAPDVLQIDLVAAVPKPPYHLQPLDAISLRGFGLLPDSPLQGVFQVDSDGTVNLGAAYGTVSIVGLTVAEAKDKLVEAISKVVLKPILEVALAQTRGMQQIRGQHLVRPDGTVWFDIYGSVRVVGMTLPQARKAIEDHLGQYFLNPQIAVSITGYNSKVYYVIFDSGFNGGGTLFRLPVTGNEKIIDAISQVGGLPQTADYKRIWIARPGPAGCPPQLLPIDWRGITEFADVSTNYQILPGDRIFVKAAPAVSFGARVDRVLAPIERILGFYLLGQAVAQNGNNNFNSGGLGF